MNLSSGKIWPYAISLAIFFIFSACVTSIVVTTQYAPVELSDQYMMNYHEADAQANDLINAQIAFDKNYDFAYIPEGLNLENTEIVYKITDKNQHAINDAKIKVVLTRPDQLQYNMEFENPTIRDGIYSFNDIKLPLEGRWNIIAKVEVGEHSRYYNLKADTRETTVKEY
ncbi:MAG: FixH family protein [Sulfurimonadaceae bacterium]|jgi:nitrogen fixation protein FixH|nr:FixH family protein [Sulfurimonadaceae bacterium]